MAEKERDITDLLLERSTHEEITVGQHLQQVASSIRSEDPEASITVDCSDGVTIRATTQCMQAIRELVRNAIIHNDSASPEVTLIVSQTEGATWIEIGDRGPRNPEIERNVLVDDTGQTPLSHGSGLGLWLVKLITSRSGGTITYAENSPRGNIVGIELCR